MSLPVPLTVRIKSPTSDRHVTRELSNLTFEKGVPGGFKSCTLQLSRPIDVMQTDLAAYARVYVYDGRTGLVVWEGSLEDPGRGVNADGQVWSLVALGPSGHARDRAVPYILIDRVMERFERAASNAPGATLNVADDPGGSDNDAIVLQFPSGQVLATSAIVLGRYSAIQSAGQKLAAFNYIWDAGSIAATVSLQAVTRTDAGAGTLVRDQTLTSAGGAQSIRTVVSDFTNGHNVFDIRIIYTGAGATVANDTLWASVMNLYVAALRLTKAGVEVTTGYNVDVVASEVVADLLGRFLTQFDGANATIATTTFAIQQLAYEEPVTPADVLDDLMLLEPLHYWVAWESNAAGKYRFEWLKWPTTVRYEASVEDGFDAPQSTSDLYNRVTVRWVGPKGKSRITRRTQTVPALDDLGIIREASIDLGSSLGSTTAATQVGDGFLVDHKYPSNRGTLAVSRPIRDLLTGQMVDPWEIVPGYLIRVRGVESYPDALNASDRDGITVFRVVETAYSSSDNTAFLALDAPARTPARTLGVMQRRAEARP